MAKFVICYEYPEQWAKRIDQQTYLVNLKIALGNDGVKI